MDFFKDLMNGRFGFSLKKSSKAPLGPVDFGPVIKSPLDPKNYKAIRLPNGLRALLVSTCLHELECGQKPFSNDASLNDQIREFNKKYLDLDDIGGQSSTKCKNEKVKRTNKEKKQKSCKYEDNEATDSESDDENMNSTQAPKQTEGRTKPTPHPGKKRKVIGCCRGPATICVAIEAGSFHDHPEVYGLAHLVEHLVFLGSERYPEPNTLFSRVYETGGSINATTYAEHTIFYYSSSCETFEEILDILVDSIVNTNLKPERIKKEIEAIDSEYGIKQTCDITRLNDFLRSRAKHKHPMKKFYWGNRESLTHPNLIEIIREWKAKYYVANNMTLCIQGPFTIEKLEEMVEKYFGPISRSPPGCPSPLQELQKFGPPFDPENFYTKYYVAPVHNTTCIFLTWLLDPKFWLDYVTHPLHYIRQMLNSKAPGSLLRYLKAQRWISESMSVEVSCHCTDNFCRNSFGSVFSLTFYVTDLGYEYREELVDAVFSYLNMLRGVPTVVSKRLFQEMQATRANAFHFQNWNELEQSGISTALTLQHVNPTYVLLHHFSLSLKYDEDKIFDCLEELTPRRVNIIFVCPQNQEMCRDVAWACKIRYMKEKLTKKRYDELEGICVLRDFKMPPFGTFLSKRILLGEKIDRCGEGLLYKSPILSIYYETDKKVPCLGHRVPSASYSICFSSPFVASQSKIKPGMMDLWTSIARELTIFSMAHKYGTFFSEYDMFGSVLEGIVVDLMGPSSYLPEVLQHIVQCLFPSKGTQYSEGIFLDIKSECRKYLANSTFDTDILCRDILDYLMQSDHLCIFEAKDEITDLTYKEFLNLCELFRRRMKIFVYLNGMVSKQDVEFITNLLGAIPLSAPYGIQVIRERTTMIPRGLSLLQVQGIHPAYVTSVVMNYYQVGRRNETHAAYVAILNRVLKRRFPNQLRTMEQLGYTAYIRKFDNYGSIGLITAVFTHPNRCSTEYVDARVADFFANFANMLKKQENLVNLFSRYCNGNQEMMEDIRNFFKEHFLPTGKFYKKLSIHVKGHHPGQTIHKRKREELRGERQGDHDPHEIVQLEYLEPNRAYERMMKAKSAFTSIQNISKYKAEMGLFGLEVD